MIVLFTGGRDYNDEDEVRRVLQSIAPTLVVTGGAPGLDYIANDIALSIGIATAIFPANWVGDNQAAGPIRNKRMLDLIPPDLVAAFDGGTGTADMAMQARRRGIKVRRYGKQKRIKVRGIKWQ